jgi:hypothetical protein
MQVTSAVANVAFYRAGEDEPFKTVPTGIGQFVRIPEKAHRMQLFLTVDPIPPGGFASDPVNGDEHGDGQG